MAIPTTQKTLLAREESALYVVAETPVPTPGPKDVLVQIHACALNPVDWAIVYPPYSKMLIKEWPHVPGTDGAGVVVALGSEVSNLKEGDKVVFQGTWTSVGATCQQYAIVPADLTAIIPNNITFEEAATLPLALTTDVLSLYNQSPAEANLSLRLKPVWTPEGQTAYAGTPAFIVGGAASLGQIAIQLARLAGHTPIITTASPHNATLLESLGATHVLDRALPNDALLASLPAILGGKPLEFVFAAVAAPDALRLARDALAPGGALATVLPAPQRIPEDVANPGEGKRVGYVFGSARLPYTHETGVDLFKHLSGWLEKGLLKPNPVEVLPNGLAGVTEGLARLKAKKVSGKKLVVHPQETA
ncbi:GroES-like protein [Trametes versicolor FP-101664 SS1]|uniref:GroES-like protein n=1 Tax=Trametes versicolor (strain FP-101664) TaxID=717944 RepID=UPI0004621F8F|nr:GroES-like protein [Trametes versicolor FP-101664 SS1]EIW54862.1 GroES-like protein [Trametes versicolor FP-101664 SS1]